jgi:sporulation protein YunB
MMSGRRRKFVPRLRRMVPWLLVLLGCAMFFYWVEQTLQPALRHVATIRLQQIATQAINKAVTEQLAGAQSFQQLIEWKQTGEGRINGVQFNQQVHAQLTAACTRVVEQTLEHLQEVPEYIPLGMLLDSSLIAQFGPRIKLTLMPAGVVRAQMGSEMKEAGINTTMLEIFVTIRTDIRVLVGFDSAGTSIETRIPLAYAVINGEVPQYYMKSPAQSPSPNHHIRPPMFISP